ncbi:unnamed protein product [Lupinus luteus]|uniref:Inositol polyphosphate-related phosphatase domain-containing protein n=1 Tax=Lupinus luteus TaxID=3873 RepID=A0AAV1WB67_LUPLU
MTKVKSNANNPETTYAKTNVSSEESNANNTNFCIINANNTNPMHDTGVKNEKKKKSIFPKIFGSKRSGRGSDEDALKSQIQEGDGVTLERETSPGIEGLNLSNFERGMAPETEIQSFRFQEIVPLSAGNVLVVEDNEPAAKWLALISEALNRPKNEHSDSSDSGTNSKNLNLRDSKSSASVNFFQKPSLKVRSRNYRAEGSSLLKACNCPINMPSRERRRSRLYGERNYGSLGEQGEKEGDELKRNADVSEILKGIQFSRIGKNHCQQAPEKIVDHDRIIWLGDLNYRVSLSYDETRVLLENNDWDALLEKDQLNIERDAGRVFNGFEEGRILFAPTYKYSHNSDSYAGETTKSKRKRRTPAWCDRILWRGNGIEQFSYIRGESRFSDHRPVCAVFCVNVKVRSRNIKFRKGYSYTSPRGEYEDIPQRHSFYD